MSRDCLFCRIVSGEIPSPAWIARTDRAFAFLDIQPLRPGHTLVVPTTHATDLEDVTEEDWQAVNRLVRQVASLLRARLGTEGENLIVASGAAAEQAVFHLHVHVVPRRAGDELGWSAWTATKVSRPPAEELAALAARIRGGR
jgi:histidine triad (HIT) family protein